MARVNGRAHTPTAGDAATLRFAPPSAGEGGLLPRCLGCGYDLSHQTVPRCPECGREFDPADRRTFRRLPAFVAWLYFLPGVALALILGAAVAGVLLLHGSIGWGLTFGVPMALGAFVGYGFRPGTFMGVVLLIVPLVCALVGMLMVADAVGALCGAIFSGIFVVPTAVGVLAGFWLRSALKASGFSQRHYLPAALVVLLLPAALHAAERALDLPRPPETFASTHLVPLPPAEAFHLRPAPTPGSILPEARSLPSGLQAGDAAEFPAGKGTLAIRVTERVEGRRFAFEYVGQREMEDRAVRLIGSSFDFREAEGGSEVTVTTSYQPLMTPRWAWRPFEHRVGEAVHAATLSEVR